MKKKGFDLEHTIRLVRHLGRAGLCGSINIIPGFPGETAEDFLATVEVCRELGLRGEFFPFCLLKGSPLYREPERFGIVVREQAKKDLAVMVPFEHQGAAPQGVPLIKLAARHYWSRSSG